MGEIGFYDFKIYVRGTSAVPHCRNCYDDGQASDMRGYQKIMYFSL